MITFAVSLCFGVSLGSFVCVFHDFVESMRIERPFPQPRKPVDHGPGRYR